MESSYSVSSDIYCTCGNIVAGILTIVVAVGCMSIHCVIAVIIPTQVSASATTNSNPVFSSSSATTNSPAERVKVWFEERENSFVCQCNDGTWNHRAAQVSYSNCPNQVASTSLTTISSKTIIPTSVACTVVFDPGSPYWGPPFYECDNGVLITATPYPGTLSARTTTPTLSEPNTSGTAAFATIITPLTAVSTFRDFVSV